MESVYAQFFGKYILMLKFVCDSNDSDNMDLYF